MALPGRRSSRSADHRPGALVTVVLALLTTLQPSVASGGVGPRCEVRDRIEKRTGGWETIHLPPYAPGFRNTNLDIASDPADPLRLAATNGASIQLSLDGGCTWNLVYDANAGLPALPAYGVGPKIVDLEMASLGDGKARLFAVHAAPEPILVSDDDGKTWKRSTNVGTPTEFAAAPSDPNFAYQVVTGYTNFYEPQFYASTDGGLTWERRSGGAQIFSPIDCGTSPNCYPVSSVTDLDVDPTDPKKVWLSSPMIVYVSEDGGQSWRAIDSLPGRLGRCGAILLELGAPPGGPLQIALSPAGADCANDPQGPRSILVSADAAKTWAPVPVPEAVWEMEIWGSLDSMLMYTRRGTAETQVPGVWRRDRRLNDWVDIAQPYQAGGPGRSLSVSGTSSPVIYLSSSADDAEPVIERLARRRPGG